MISFNAHNISGKKTLGVIIEQYHNLRLNENSYGLTVTIVATFGKHLIT